MARTKKQVLQATARKQQLHLEAVERAAKEAAAAAAECSPAKKAKADDSTQTAGILVKKFDSYDRPPGRPKKNLSPPKDQGSDKHTETGKSNHDVPLYKKIISSQKKGKPDEKEKVKEEKKVSVESSQNAEDDLAQTSPVSGPVNLKKTKLTARKSTNAFKKAEAREFLESLAKQEAETKVSPEKLEVLDQNEFQARYTVDEGFVLPPGDDPINISEIDMDWDNIKFPLSFPSGRVYARKTMTVFKPTARKSVKSKKVAKGKLVFTARKSFPPCIINPDFNQPSTSTDMDSLTVFPSVHEAVITLPKSQKLPVALVCINDIYKEPRCDQDGENVIKETPKKKPSPRGRKPNRPNSPRRSSEKAKSPRRSPKGERRSKNIFEQFQNEITDEESPRSRKLGNSPGRKGANQRVASTTFASAMKVLRSVSEKVDGKRRKSDYSPRKRSPRRNSLKLEIPDPSASLMSLRNSTSPVTSRYSTSPARSPRSGKKQQENPERRRSGSASPRGCRRIKSPSTKLRDDNVMFMPLVRKGKLSPKANSQEFLLTLKKGSSPNNNNVTDACKSEAARQLDFMKVCNEQIVKNLIEVTSEEGGTLSVRQSCEPDPYTKSSSPGPSSSMDDLESSTPVSKSQTRKQLLDLISKVDSRIKDVVFTPLESQCTEDDESEPSSLNTSHNSDTLTQLIDQMESENTGSKPTGTQPEVSDSTEVKDSIPSDVKCGELYRRLIGKGTDKPVFSSLALETAKTEPVKIIKSEPSDIKDTSVKNESCLLKKHLLSDVVSISSLLEQKPSVSNKEVDIAPAVSVNCEKADTSAKEPSVPNGGEPSEGKRVPLWKKSYKTKEPLPLNILSKVEKIAVVDKKSAFVSDELENYLESSKNLSLTSQGTPEHLKDKSSPESKEEIPHDLKDIEPDFDEVEGVLFLSFSTKDAMEAHIAVEKKNKWDKDANHLLGVSRLLAFEKEKDVCVDGETPEQVRAKTHGSQNLRGQHMKWKKYRRMLRQEFENLKTNRDKADFYSGFHHPEKTSDITKIKGWRNKYDKYLDMSESETAKLHWRTEERLLRNLEPDDIKALGIKKKRRKNVVFTHRKGTSKEVGYPVGRTSTYGQSASPEEGDNWNMMLDEYEEPLFGGGSDHSDDEMKAVNWSRSLGEDSLNVSEEYDVKDRPFGYAKKKQIRQEFAELFNWGEDEMRIMKNLGGRVRNRRKKNDPTDMTKQLIETESPEIRKRFRMKMKVKRSDYVPVSIITERMALDALCALDFGKYKPTKPGTGYADNIITKSSVIKKIQPSTLAGLKLLKKGKALLRAQQEKKSVMLRSGASGDCVKRRSSGETPSREWQDGCEENIDSKRSCDKPGCRYGCICHLCNDNQEELEPKPQESSVHTCNKEYCRLGCICDSLTTQQELERNTAHCGKPECMIECVCSKTEGRPSTGTSSADHPDDGGLSSDEIPSLIQDSDISSEGPKFESEKPKEDEKTTAQKTWSRHAKGDKYSNLPKRESRHRVSKNLDAITRKAMMVYETSEVYCEQSGRRKKHGDEVSPAPRTTVSKLSPPAKLTKGAVSGKMLKRKHSASQEVLQISDDDENISSSSCARLSSYSPTKQKDLTGDPTVVKIENAEDESGASSICITPGNSRPSTPTLTSKVLSSKLVKLAPKNTEQPQVSDKSKPEPAKNQPAEQAKKKLQNIVSADLSLSSWHTQMVCLKANPKPKDPKSDAPDTEGEEIKLLEFMANCNWDNAKPHILSRVAQCLSRGVYPDPKRMVIGDFIVEILPKADKCAVIPPELRDKLPNSMFSIRVKVMRKATEKDIRKCQMKAGSGAHIKQRTLNKPRDTQSTQSCDTASKRVFQKTNANKTLAQTSPRGVTAPPVSSPQVSAPQVSTPTTTSSSAMGISGLSRLQISQPTAAFIDSGGNTNNRSQSELTKLHNISSVKSVSNSVVENKEQITVLNNETGDSISMILEHSETSLQKDAKERPENTIEKKIESSGLVLNSVDTDDGPEPEPKILKAKTGSSLMNLGKIPLSGSWDGNIDNILTSENKDEDTIDLTDDSSVNTLKKKPACEQDVVLLDSTVKGKRKSPIDHQGKTNLSKDVNPETRTKKTPMPSSGAKVGKADQPQPPPIGQILVPIGSGVPNVGSKIIIAGPSPIPNATRPTKTIISTPGGKLYGPFNDLNDVKRLQVKGPDGSTQPLINLLSANSLPIVQTNSVVPLSAKPMEGMLSSTSTANDSKNRESKRKPKAKKTAATGTRAKRESKKNKEAVNTDGANPATGAKKVKRSRKKLKVDPVSNGISEKIDELDTKSSFDEVDSGAASGAPVTTPKSQVMVIPETKLPVGRRKSVEIHLTSGEKFVVTEKPSKCPGVPQIGLARTQTLLKDTKTSDKENNGETCAFIKGDGDCDRISSQEGMSMQGQPAGYTLCSGDGPRQVRSSSLDSMASNTIRTSTPIQGGQKAPKLHHGFLPIKRQRSGSDSAALADANKRIKLLKQDQSSGSLVGAEVMTPIQKFRERMNMSMIDISDDDSQMSSCSGGSLQGLNSNNMSEDEDLDVQTLPTKLCVNEDAREILYRKFKDESVQKTGDQREKKTNRERARRMDILCMFMYLYNTVSKGEEVPYEALSRQKVLDSALETIDFEKRRSKELEDELYMVKFYHRAQERRLKSAVDHLIKKGTSAKSILSHLEEVRQKEEKRLSKKKLLRKIIEYGIQTEVGDSEDQKKAVPTSSKSSTKSRTFKTKTQTSTEGSGSQTVLENLKSNLKTRVDPDNPSQYWSENFVIEIEKDGEEQGEATGVGNCHKEIQETVATSKENDNNEREKLSSTERREITSRGEVTRSVREMETGVNSGNSSSMQKSPVLGESDENLRDEVADKAEHGTLHRSNSEEAILQVESFIENAEKWSPNFEDESNASTKCDDKPCELIVSSLSNSSGLVDHDGKSDEKETFEVDACTESPEREKSEDRESIFESLLPCEVNFDDASIESVPLEPKIPNSVCPNENESEQNAGQIKKISVKEETQELTEEGMAEREVSSTESTNDEKFLICDVRGLAKDEFFCTK